MEPEVVVHRREDRELRKRVIVQGDCDVVPYEDASCLVAVSEVRCTDAAGACPLGATSAVLQRAAEPVRLTVGDADTALDRDLELLLRHMCLGERCVATLSYRNKGGRLVREVSCQLHLLEASTEPLVADWPWERLLQRCEAHKERGVALVKDKRPLDAFLRFGRAFKLLLAMEPLAPSERRDHLLDLKVRLYNNLAYCQLEARGWAAAAELASSALQLRPRDAKALYRRSAARAQLGLHEEAWADVRLALQVAPGDPAAVRAARLLEPTVRAINRDYAAVMKKMFS